MTVRTVTEASPDPVAAAAEALGDFLRAVGAPVGEDPELCDTPLRAARAFYEELLDGYRGSVEEVLSGALPTTERGSVTLLDLSYASVCPHHLLPTWGRAHVGYQPEGKIVGLGVIARLVEVLSHRLILQESLGARIAGALVEHLGASGAGVVLEAQHTCLSLRGPRQHEARVVTRSFAGRWAHDATEREGFLQTVVLGRRGR